jgi:hypothetical protein
MSFSKNIFKSKKYFGEGPDPLDPPTKYVTAPGHNQILLTKQNLACLGRTVWIM